MGVVVAHTNGTNKFAFAALSTQDGGTQQEIARLTNEGKFDPTYADGGKRVGLLPAIDGFTYTGSVGVQSRGHLIYAGTTAADVALARLDGSSQLSIDNVGAGNGDGGEDPGDGDGTVLHGGGGGAFGWLTLGFLGGAALVRRRLTATAQV
jgi:hypothetical protein